MKKFSIKKILVGLGIVLAGIAGYFGLKDAKKNYIDARKEDEDSPEEDPGEFVEDEDA